MLTLHYSYIILIKVVYIPVARGGSRGSVEPPFRVTGSKYFSHTPHITSGIIVICSIVLNLNLNYLLFQA